MSELSFCLFSDFKNFEGINVKQQKLWLLAVLFIATAALLSGQRTYAEWNAEAFKNEFNNLNGGLGFCFAFHNELASSNPSGLVLLANYGNSDPVNLSAYSATVFPGLVSTFCVQPNIHISTSSVYYSGTLSYADGKTFTYSVNLDNGIKNLTVFAAFLYKEYVSGHLSPATVGVNPETESFDTIIGSALRFLLHGTGSIDSRIENWLYVQSLQLGINLTEVYDPNKHYSFMDDYYVFVMNVYGYDTDGTNRVRSQDFLYIVKDSPEHLPEPATILLWTLGTAGMLGYARRRSRMT